jgi:hypothetical protein
MAALLTHFFDGPGALRMMDMENQSAGVQALLDREAIRDCIYRYCRGIDRVDEDLLRAAYWPDASDSHGPYQGSASGFIDWAMERLASAGRGVHFIGNILIELHGNVAAVETCFQALQQSTDASGKVQHLHLWGRYADRFEKRGGEWRVAVRVVIYDAIDQAESAPQTDLERFGALRQPLGERREQDAMYRLLATVRNEAAAGRNPAAGTP